MLNMLIFSVIVGLCLYLVFDTIIDFSSHPKNFYSLESILAKVEAHPDDIAVLGYDKALEYARELATAEYNKDEEAVEAVIEKYRPDLA